MARSYWPSRAADSAIEPIRLVRTLEIAAEFISAIVLNPTVVFRAASSDGSNEKDDCDSVRAAPDERARRTAALNNDCVPSDSLSASLIAAASRPFFP